MARGRVATLADVGAGWLPLPGIAGARVRSVLEGEAPRKPRKKKARTKRADTRKTVKVGAYKRRPPRRR